MRGVIFKNAPEIRKEYILKMMKHLIQSASKHLTSEPLASLFLREKQSSALSTLVNVN